MFRSTPRSAPRRKPPHRREVCDADIKCRIRNGHEGQSAVAKGWARSAVERLVAVILEFKPAFPAASAADALHKHLDQAIRHLRVIPAGPGSLRALTVPQGRGVPNRNRSQVRTVERGAPPSILVGLVRSLLPPYRETVVPERQGLHRGGLARVARPGEYNRVSESDIESLEPLEISDRQTREHRMAPVRLGNGEPRKDARSRKNGTVPGGFLRSRYSVALPPPCRVAGRMRASHRPELSRPPAQNRRERPRPGRMPAVREELPGPGAGGRLRLR